MSVNKPLVKIIFGSESDRLISESAKNFLDEKDIDNETLYASADRKPKRVRRIIRSDVRSDRSDFYISGASLAAVITPSINIFQNIYRIKKLNFGVPVEDPVFEGLPALLTIQESPPRISHQRPTVGINRGDVAAYAVWKVLTSKWDDFTIAVEDALYQESITDKIQKKVPKDEIVKPKIIPTSLLNQNPENLILVYYNQYGILNSLDNQYKFIIGCKHHKKETDPIDSLEYLREITKLNHTVNVGVGNISNAICLASDLIETNKKYRKS